MTDSTPGSATHQGPVLPRPPLRKRVAAAVAIVSGAAAVVAATGLALTSPFLSVLAVLAAVIVIAGLWLAVTRKGPLRLLAATVAAAALVALVVLLVFVRPWFIPVVVVALVVSSITARIAMGIDPKDLAAIPKPGRNVHRAHHPVLLCNPRSGDGKAERTGLIDAARTRHIHVIELGSDDDLAALARGAIDDGADAIGMAGGDGSLAIVAAVASERDVPFVCVPAGTRNHFALDLGLDRDDPVAALDAFGPATEQRVDLATVNDRTFVNNVSLGVYGAIVQRDDYRDAKLRTMFDLAPDLLGPESETFDLRFDTPEGESFSSAHLILVSNNQYQLGQLDGFGSRASLADGRLGVVAVPTEGGFRRIDWVADTFRVDADGAVDAAIDGEATTLDPPLEFRAQPGALRIRLAHSAPGYSPAAIAPHSGFGTLERLVRVVLGHPPR